MSPASARDAESADREAQRARDRDRQRHGLARDRRPLCAIFCAKEGLTDDLQRDRERVGRSIYSASDIARQEFPDLDLTVRGAISIARRLQDPLAELVKIDPKSIGVGQYQHDVDQTPAAASRSKTVIESCVNRVGVDLNTASWALLRYVAGITERTAQKIVEFRNEHGPFPFARAVDRGAGRRAEDVRAGGGLSAHPRRRAIRSTSTAVHPESYPVVEQIAQSLDVPIDELIRQAGAAGEGRAGGLRRAGVYTLNDILRGTEEAGPRSAREVRGAAVQ